MKKITILLILLAYFSIDLWGINYYFSGDTLQIWAVSGLTLRDASSKSGKKIVIIPYGEKIIAQSTKTSRYAEEQLEVSTSYKTGKISKYLSLELSGKWLSVKYGNVEGYVFDAYLSKYIPPKIRTDSQVSETLDGYLERVFGLVEKRKEQSDGDVVIREKYYGKGTSFFNIGSKTAYVRYLISQLSIEEILLFIKNTKIANDGKQVSLIEDKLEETTGMRILKFSNYFEGEAFLEIKVLGGVIIWESESSC